MKFDGTATNVSSSEQLTLDKLMESVNALKSLPPVPRMPRLIASHLCENVPRMTLSDDVPVTPEFRAEINAWMLDFFGVHDVAYEMNDPLTGDQVVVASRRHVESIKSQMMAQEYAHLLFPEIFR